MRSDSMATNKFSSVAGKGLLGQRLQRLRESVGREWNTTPGWGLVVLAAPFLVALSSVAAAAAGKDAYKWFTQEDGFAESMQVLLYAAALVISLLLTRRLWTSGERGLGGLYLLLSVGFFFLIGEEVNWGQRIFGWVTPETWGDTNKQEETNLHNIYGVGDTFKWVQMLVGAYGAFLPLLVLRAKALARYRHKLAFLVPPLSLTHYFFFMFVWRAYRNLVPVPDRLYFVVSEYNEVIELILALGFLVFVIYQLRRIRLRQRAQAMDAEGISAT